MERNEPNIQEELLLLYELSLSVGQTLDPDTTCREFLRVLMAKRNLVGASIWWRANDEGAASDLRLLHGIPRAQILFERLSPGHPLCLLAASGEPHSRTGSDPGFDEYDIGDLIPGGSWAVYPLGSEGILLMSSPSASLFTPRMLGQLRSVTNKLTTALQGSLAYARLRESEATLRERSRQLDDSRRLLQAVIDTAPLRIYWKDRNSRYLGCNPPFCPGCRQEPSRRTHRQRRRGHVLEGTGRVASKR